MFDRTIIYYTSNLENEDFEKKVIDNILSITDLPIISVSQKPMEFGDNICVGDVGISYLNAFRQLLIGCEKATTEFVVMAESDCLYPQKGYFDYEPKNPNKIYSYNNNWILFKGKDKFYRKEQTHGGMIYGREFLINLLKKSFVGLPMWSRKKMGFPFYDKDQKFEWFGGDPIINTITGVNGRRGTSLMKDEPKEELPYWGKVNEVKQKYGLINNNSK